MSVTWGTVFFDYNNDGWLDLFFVAGEIGGAAVPQPNAFFQNNSDGTFSDMSLISGLDDTLRGRSASIADFDSDGYVDVFVGNLNRPDLGETTPFLLFHNQSADQGNNNHWIAITVEGTVGNRDGIGTRLFLTTPDGLTQIREITSGPTYGGGDYRAGFFGLNDNTTADLVVRWPNGAIETIGPVIADQKLHLVEPREPSSVLTHYTPEGFVLGTNYPNPFNPETIIPYELKDDERVTLKVYNTLGQEIATLVNEKQAAGMKSVLWNAMNENGLPVTSGVYIYRLVAGDFVGAGKMILSR